MRTLVYSAAVTALAAAAVAAGTNSAPAATWAEYCLGGGGVIVTKTNGPHQTITVCQGGRFDGVIIDTKNH